VKLGNIPTASTVGGAVQVAVLLLFAVVFNETTTNCVEATKIDE
jgi:hypothetical protein